MKSKTKISKQTEKKTNPQLVETIRLAKKNDQWIKVASILSGPRKLRVNINLEEIDKQTKEGETIVVPGKILSQGDISKKIKVVAFDFSKKAKEKLLSSKSEAINIIDEIKSNKDMKGAKILQ